MPRPKILKNNPLCACCNTNHCIDERNTLCEQCKKFIYTRLKINQGYIAHCLSNVDTNITREYQHYRDKHCSFCDDDGVIVYRHVLNKKKYLLCQAHYDKWLRLGCELGDFANLL